MNSSRFKGKVAIITASTGDPGIGYAIAKRLGEEGAHVVVCSRKQDNVDMAVRSLRNANIKVTGHVCHVANTEHRKRLIESTVKDHGGFDILVCNAATGAFFSGILETPETAWDKVFDVNVKSTFLLIKESVQHIATRGGGSIVLVGSSAAYKPYPIHGVYGITKTALLGLTKALMPELISRDIRINCVSPGGVKTKYAAPVLQNTQFLNEVIQDTALKRLASPDEIAGLVAFLCSDDASYITGENMVVAGGMNCKL